MWFNDQAARKLILESRKMPCRVACNNLETSNVHTTFVALEDEAGKQTVS